MSSPPDPMSCLSGAEITVLYLEHLAKLLAIAYRITRDGQDAEDAVHDVFVKLSKKRRIDFPSGPEANLYIAVPNRAKDILRMKMRAKREEDEEPKRRFVSLDDPTYTFLEAVESDKTQPSFIDRVTRCFADPLWLKHQLITPQRLEVLLLIIQGHTNQEIAQILSRSDEHVGKVIFDIKRTLKTTLTFIESEVARLRSENQADTEIVRQLNLTSRQLTDFTKSIERKQRIAGIIARY